MQFDWSPRIGDPTVGGWLTVILYVLASVSCWRAARKVGTRDKFKSDAGGSSYQFYSWLWGSTSN